VILGIDPGTAKVGYALLTEEGETVERGIELLGTFEQHLRTLSARHAIDVVAIGRGTNAAHLSELAGTLGVPVHLVDETETTLRARALYFTENPPRGWRRLIPIGLQLPPRPIDNYAAVLIGRRFIHRGK